ncbi:PIG-P-domain-containing protein [Gamsiella multidivaricata]|uniref:PIG-P-domain-containing protein n=1 Tax=Gamsiella multidivaricata TaxID=101098 RepID=UPI00221FDCEA|nr:PIG-P-domain-containing protein [Gamsiella multidivaricata]KAI7828051.1 PIG-P-domain-containing protein [Gamsiella multidivaricata]
MKRTASYSSFLSKKAIPFYKPTVQHARALSGQIQPPDIYTTPMDDSLPTTLTKTPTYEYYGFVLYLVSGITYAMYLGWAYLPKEVLDSMGITYYPSKYWSLALPIWLFVLIIYLYIAFFAINLYNTAPFDSFQTITDEHANPFHTMNSASSMTDDFVPDLMDIPIGMVNACLYQHIEGISDEEEEGDEFDFNEDDDDDVDRDDGSYFDDANLSDWDDPAEI